MEREKHGEFENLREAVKLDPSYINKKNKYGNTPLIEAIRNDDINLIEFLLSQGASQHTSGGTALMEACLFGNTDVVSLLLDYGATTDIRTKDGLTALMIASASSNKKTVQMLLDKGADIAIPDEDGKTAVDYANDDLKSVIISHGVSQLHLSNFPHVAESVKRNWTTLALGPESRMMDESQILAHILKVAIEKQCVDVVKAIWNADTGLQDENAATVFDDVSADLKGAMALKSVITKKLTAYPELEVQVKKHWISLDLGPETRDMAEAQLLVTLTKTAVSRKKLVDVINAVISTIVITQNETGNAELDEPTAHIWSLVTASRIESYLNAIRSILSKYSNHIHAFSQAKGIHNKLVIYTASNIYRCVMFEYLFPEIFSLSVVKRDSLQLDIQGQMIDLSDEDLRIQLIRKAVIKHLDDVVNILLPTLRFMDENTFIMSKEMSHLWTEFVMSPEDVYQEVVVGVMDRYLDHVYVLTEARDAIGRRALDIASLHYRSAMLERIYFYKRYEFREGPAEHKSATCIVKLAKDQWDNGKLVALKFMINRDQFLRELSMRVKNHFDPDFIITTIRSHNGDEDMPFKTEALKKGYYAYCVVMPAAERNLAAVIAHEHIAGRDWDNIRLITKQLAEALEHMHSKGTIHGDIKPLNIMRMDNHYKLIDLDASVSVTEGEFVGGKYSSGFIPPELIALTDEGKALVRTFVTDQTTGLPILEQLPYELIPATPAHDMWSLGVTLFQLFTGKPLWHIDDEGNIDQSQMLKLQQWNVRFKDSILSQVHKTDDPIPRNLLARLLSKDPCQRPSPQQVLAHPFLSGKKASRLVGDKPQYDVFISYRVASDADLAEYLYNSLTKIGLRVYWDKVSLKAGVNWEEGFCDGLVSSRIFVPLLSRDSINHSTIPWQNFSSLEENSRCDNVFLEHRLALELHHLGLLEYIHPLMIGDSANGKSVPVDERVYSNYFKTGCNPNTKDVQVTSVEEKVLMHMDRQGLGGSVANFVSVKAVLSAITSFQGFFVEGKGSEALLGAVEAILKMSPKESNDSIELHAVEISQEASAAKRSESVIQLENIRHNLVEENIQMSEALDKLKIALKISSDGEAGVEKYLAIVDLAISRLISDTNPTATSGVRGLLAIRDAKNDKPFTRDSKEITTLKDSVIKLRTLLSMDESYLKQMNHLVKSSLEKLLNIINIPHTPETDGIIGEEEVYLKKVLVNVKEEVNRLLTAFSSMDRT